MRYLLEGSVRKAGNRVRITGQLIEAETGTHLWADKFDAALDDIFELQDRVTASVAGAIEPTVTRAEIERAGRKPPESLQAYDYLLRAIAVSRPITREGNAAAIALARRAIELDPNYALAHAFFAWLHGWRRNRLWMADEAAETSAAVSHAMRAIDLERDDATVLSYAAHGIVLLTYDMQRAMPWLDRAIGLNPNSVLALSHGASVRAFLGDYDKAIGLATRALRLSPFGPMTYQIAAALGVSHLLLRKLPEAIEWLGRSFQEMSSQPSPLTFRASALAHAGRVDEARAAIARVLELRPGTTLTWFRERSGVQVIADLEYLLDGLRLAGLPE